MSERVTINLISFWLAGTRGRWCGDPGTPRGILLPASHQPRPVLGIASDRRDGTQLRRGIQLSCIKRPISLPQIEGIVDEVTKLALRHSDKEIRTENIGYAVMIRLRDLDDVSAPHRWISTWKVSLKFELRDCVRWFVPR